MNVPFRISVCLVLAIIYQECFTVFVMTAMNWIELEAIVQVYHIIFNPAFFNHCAVVHCCATNGLQVFFGSLGRDIWKRIGRFEPLISSVVCLINDKN